MSGEETAPIRVEVTRGGRLESVHDVDVAVTDAGDRAVLSPGRPDRAVFVRSAVKPFQALPLVADGIADEYGLSAEQLALVCGSHSGEVRHVEVAQSILERIGLTEDALACGPHEPFSGSASRALHAAGREPGRVHNNCSGKHAGMLVLARGHGWPVEGYQEADHPVQRRILAEVARWTGVEPDEIGTGVDGCGVVTFALPLTALAGALARLARAAAEDPDGAAGRIVGAMVGHPFLVAGTNRLCTALMTATGGRVVAKVGAEGVYGAASLDRGWGLALKARDGARRAAEAALVAVVEELGLLAGAEPGPLEKWVHPVLENTRGEVVGELRVRVEVKHAG